MKNPILYRRRLIPNECILLKDDRILSCDEEHIVTSWNTLHPKADLHHGASCYFLKEGFKVSRFCREDDSLLFWYCDIVDYDYREDSNELIVTDLLADVIIYPDGFVKVVDLDELADAFQQGLLSAEALTACLYQLNKLLTIIYNGNFSTLQSQLERAMTH